MTKPQKSASPIAHCQMPIDEQSGYDRLIETIFYCETMGDEQLPVGNVVFPVKQRPKLKTP
jgi:hypothetical protein